MLILFVKRKHHRGAAAVSKDWVFGGVERGTNRCFMVVVHDRSAETQLAILQRYISDMNGGLHLKIESFGIIKMSFFRIATLETAAFFLCQINQNPVTLITILYLNFLMPWNNNNILILTLNLVCT